MTTLLASPRILKGAIVSIPRLDPVATVIVFQYNPEKVTRSLQGKVGAASGERTEVLRIQGPPAETITLRAEVDATDQLERADAVATAQGIYPQLSALEVILYPTSKHVRRKTRDGLLGTLEIAPPEAPLTLLVWGTMRAVPVRITSLSITETAFDARLNPIQAEVDLSLQVLTYDDFPVEHRGSALFLTYQVLKETSARLGSVKGLGALGGGLRLR